MNENEKISLGGANGGANGGNNNMGSDGEFAVPTENVSLPSLGVFYPNKNKLVTIRYMTAESDNTLFSTDLVRSGKVLDVILDESVLDKDIRPVDMISGDRNLLLIEIRKTGFGNEYFPDEKKHCSACGEDYKPMVDLDKLKPKVLEIMPDEDGLYPLIMPVTKTPIRFRLLRGSDENRLSRLIESGKKGKAGNLKPTKLITERYLLQIMEVNGSKDKTYISKFISAMPTKDSLFFREYNKQVEPGIDLSYDFECPFCHDIENSQVRIDSRLFYPEVE